MARPYTLEMVGIYKVPGEKLSLKGLSLKQGTGNGEREIGECSSRNKQNYTN